MHHDDDDDFYDEEYDDDGDHLNHPPNHPPSNNPTTRLVLHLDLDCFYAQVEEILHPEFSGKPLGVLQRTFLVTCNYPARARGVKKLMPLIQAQTLCPEIAIVPSVMDHYRDASRKVFNAIRSSLPKGWILEQASIDEGYIEAAPNNSIPTTTTSPPPTLPPETIVIKSITPNHHSDSIFLFGAHIASIIRSSVKSATGLTCTIGVSQNKSLAKLASTLHKPDKISLLLPSALDSLFAELPLKQLPSIGPKIAELLLSAKCDTVASVAALEISKLRTIVGVKDADRVAALVRGQDQRAVYERGPPRTVSAEQSLIGGLCCKTWEDLQVLVHARAVQLAPRIALDKELHRREPGTLLVRFRLGYGAPIARSTPFPRGNTPHADEQRSQAWIAAVTRAAMSLLRQHVPLSSLPSLTRLGIAATSFTQLAAASIERFLVRKKKIDDEVQSSTTPIIPAAAAATLGEKEKKKKITGIKRYLKQV